MAPSIDLSAFDVEVFLNQTAPYTDAKVPFRDDMLRSRMGFAEIVWDTLISKGAAKMKENNYSKHLVTFEVGAHRAKQSKEALKSKFHTHVFEPSPSSFAKIKMVMEGITSKDPELDRFLHLHNVAVGSTTGDILEFETSGSTGDHVGQFDVWHMKPGESKFVPKEKQTKMIQVPSMKLDDLIHFHSTEKEIPIDEVYAAKIDTQGFEPKVFQGLEESIKNHKIQYLITEYWPKGMALMNNRTDTCDLAMETLHPMIAAGYTIYALPLVAHASIKAPYLKNWSERPFDDIKADCEYLLDLENRYPLEDYHMVSVESKRSAALVQYYGILII